MWKSSVCSVKHNRNQNENEKFHIWKGKLMITKLNKWLII